MGHRLQELGAILEAWALPEMTGDPAGSLQDPRLSIRGPHLCCRGGCLGSVSGTHPGAVVCSPARLAGWDQPRGPGAAALETGKPERGYQRLPWTGSQPQSLS